MTDKMKLSDLRNVVWGKTLLLLLARGLASGIVVGVLTLFSPTGSFAMTLAAPFIWALFFVPAAFIMHFVAIAMSKANVPFSGIIGIIASLMVCIGDPIVNLINNKFPNLFGSSDIKMFNFHPLLFILK